MSDVDLFSVTDIIFVVGHIYRTDGFFGLYRGLGCKLIAFAICNGVTNSVQTVGFKHIYYLHN